LIRGLRGRVGVGAFWSDAVDMYRAGDVLEVLVADILEGAI
jgi:hypothetical protein